MRQITLTECHKKADSLDTLDVQRQGFQFFVVQQVHVLFAHLIEIVFPFDFHGFGFHPFAVFDVAALCRNLPDVDFRIEVGSERIAVVTAVAVQNVDIIDFVKVVLLGIGAEYASYAGIKAAAQQSRDASLFETFPIRPLPLVFKLCRIFRLVVCGVHIIGLGGKTSVHNGQILIGECHIDHNVRLFLFNQSDQLVYIIGIHLCRGDLGSRLVLQFFLELVTLGLGTAGNADLCKYFAVLAALVNDNACHAAGSDN